MSSIFLVAEADGEVGFGHLAELRAVAASLRERDVAPHRVGIGPVSPEDGVEWLPDFEAVTQRVIAAKPRVIAWSVRTSRWRSIWPRVERLESRHLWIADVADDYPAVQTLVIPTLQPQWRRTQSRTKVFSGPQYFPLDVRGPREVTPMRARTGDVLLTLGGADRTEASLRIAPALAGTKSTVVIGPAFRHRDQVSRIASSCGLDIADAPAGLRELLLRHRIVISAGGNTLFEAAAAGTPALVAWEDPHELAQGTAFADKRAARVLGRGAALETETVRDAVISLLSSERDLENMSSAGRGLVDGRGAERIADLVLELAAGVAA